MTDLDPKAVAEIVAILEARGIERAAEEAEAIVCAAPTAVDAHAFARRRAEGAPLAYVLGRQRFMGVELLAAPGALVPRTETELLGETASRILGEKDAEGRGLVAIDMCCGSGNLACGIASRLGSLTVFASDLTDGCVGLARRNVEHLGLASRVTVVQGDLFAPLAGRGLEGRVDVVVCNPPYISTGRLGKDRATLLAHEPVEAFDGGPYGLSIHQRVVGDALAFLAPRGWLLFEIGAGQDKQLKILFQRSRAYDSVELLNDSAGIPRVVCARKQAV